MREPYDSDITREQYSLISEMLESAKKRTRPRKVDLYEVLCAILYLLKNACTWRNIPHDFPKWKSVRYYFDVWTKPNDEGEAIIDKVLSNLVDEERVEAGRNPEPSMLIIDSKSVKNADCAEEKGYDGGKKVSGIKIHGAMDVLGLPYAICVTTANVTDRNGAIEMFTPGIGISRLRKLLCDGSYTGDDFAAKMKELTGAEVEIAKRSELHKFAVIPKRWIVERSFGWLDKCRRLWKNCERLLATTLSMVVLAFVSVLLRRRGAEPAKSA